MDNYTLNNHYPSKELAGLPGLPTTDRAIRDKAKREQWQSRSREGIGGGREYHISSLPLETQQALMSRAEKSKTLKPMPAAIVEETANLSKADYAGKFAALPAKKQQQAEARLEILRSFWSFTSEHKLSDKAAFKPFINAWLNRQLNAPDWVFKHTPVKHGEPSLGLTTLKTWLKNYKEKGLYGLVSDYGQRKGTHLIAQNPELHDIVVGLLINAPHITPLKIQDYLAALDYEQQRNDLNVCSVSSIRRFVTHWKEKNAQVYTYLTHPDKWKNKYMVAHGSHFDGIERLNQLWEMDSTPADWMLEDGRHSVVQVIDLYSRRTKFLVTKTSTAEALITIFRQCVMDWGLPEMVRTDNGKDYVSNRFVNALDDLDVTQLLCVPFASEEKGTVERTFKTMLHSVLDLLPGFIGHNVAERKQIEARKSFAQRVMTPGEAVEVAMTSTELQEKLDQWVEYIYMRNAHRGLKGLTPFSMVANWQHGIRTVDERALDMLLMDVGGMRTVTKKGIRYNSNEYIHPALGEFVGLTVQLKTDPSDLGKLYVYGNDDYPGYICTAENYELSDISRNEFAMAAKHGQKKLMQSQAAEMKALRKNQRGNIAETVMNHKISESENVTALPSRSSEHSTAALEAAKHAAISQQQRNKTPEQVLTPEQKEEHQRLTKAMQTSAPVSTLPVNHSNNKYKQWLELKDKIESGYQPSEQEQLFFQRFPQTSAYRTAKEMAERFA